MTPQPPPTKTVEAGSAVTNFPLSKAKWMHDVPGDESSIVTFSFASLPLTSTALKSMGECSASDFIDHVTGVRQEGVKEGR
jgi:hypothetical protein